MTSLIVSSVFNENFFLSDKQCKVTFINNVSKLYLTITAHRNEEHKVSCFDNNIPYFSQ